ncbi:MAG: hypothetical protein V7603_40, partial [Micromonosporaceae bacterium]
MAFVPGSCDVYIVDTRVGGDGRYG